MRTFVRSARPARYVDHATLMLVGGHVVRRRDLLVREHGSKASLRAGGLLFDEMKLQEGLVWDQGTDTLVGFASDTFLSAEAGAASVCVRVVPAALRGEN